MLEVGQLHRLASWCSFATGLEWGLGPWARSCQRGAAGLVLCAGYQPACGCAVKGKPLNPDSTSGFRPQPRQQKDPLLGGGKLYLYCPTGLHRNVRCVAVWSLVAPW